MLAAVFHLLKNSHGRPWIRDVLEAEVKKDHRAVEGMCVMILGWASCRTHSSFL